VQQSIDVSRQPDPQQQTCSSVNVTLNSIEIQLLKQNMLNESLPEVEMRMRNYVD